MCFFFWLVIYSREKLLHRLKSVKPVQCVINAIVPLWPPIGVCPVPSVVPRLRVWGVIGRIITLSVPPVPAWQRARCATRTTERRRSSCSVDSVTGKLSSKSPALTCVCVWVCMVFFQRWICKIIKTIRHVFLPYCYKCSFFPLVYCLCFCTCRWVHASCQGVQSEEEVEKIAESSFDCSLCQGHTPLSPGKCSQ